MKKVFFIFVMLVSSAQARLVPGTKRVVQPPDCSTYALEVNVPLKDNLFVKAFVVPRTEFKGEDKKLEGLRRYNVVFQDVTYSFERGVFHGEDKNGDPVNQPADFLVKSRANTKDEEIRQSSNLKSATKNPQYYLAQQRPGEQAAVPAYQGRLVNIWAAADEATRSEKDFVTADLNDLQSFKFRRHSDGAGVVVGVKDLELLNKEPSRAEKTQCSGALKKSPQRGRAATS